VPDLESSSSEAESDGSDISDDSDCDSACSVYDLCERKQ